MAPFSHWECPLLFPYFKKWSFLPYVDSYYPFSFPYNFTLDVTPFSHWECPLLFPYFKKSLSFHTLALIPHFLSPQNFTLYTLVIPNYTHPSTTPFHATPSTQSTLSHKPLPPIQPYNHPSHSITPIQPPLHITPILYNPSDFISF